MASKYTRASFIRRTGGAVAGLSVGGSLVDPALAADAPATTPDAALRRLLTGNRRYVRQKAAHPRQGARRRHALASGQHPFATIFSCVDSRVPPEIVFDQGLGDLFVIRTAGEVVDNAVLGSIEFGTEELAIPLILVLGHEKCGAVSATIDAIESNTTPPPHIDYLVEGIRPAVEQTKGKPGDHLDNAVRKNAQLVAGALGKDTIIADAVHEGKTKVVAARYDLDTGRVSLL
jgi:carbonic anhydrase